jgi:dCMP deaminase
MVDDVTQAHSEPGPRQEGRPSFESIYMRLAFSLAARSTCRRLKVGTVITSTDFRKVLAVGYNGNASGLPNDCDREEPGNCGCLHSEENAVINCDSPRWVEKLVFVTHLPCVMCAKRLINLGNVRTVYYAETYRLTDSLKVFERGRIEVVQLRIDL